MCEEKIRSVNSQASTPIAAGAAIAPVPRQGPGRNLNNNQVQQTKTVSRDNFNMSFWWTSCVTVLLTAIIVAWIPNLLHPEPPKGNVQGTVSPKFKKVEEVFRLHLLSSEEKGAAFAVYKDGACVVDLWGGYADLGAWQRWKQTTVANTYSLNNAVVSLSLALLSERGLVEFDAPVSIYWPEFSANGKELVTVRELLTGQFGLGRLNQSLSITQLTDTEYVNRFLSEQSLRPPGVLGPVSDQGILELHADQLIRRLDPAKRSLKQFFEEELKSKFNIDYHIGLPLSEQYRAARVKGHGFSIVFEVLFAPLELISTMITYMRTTAFREMNSMIRHNDPDVRLTSLGSISGFSTARGLAQLYRDTLLIDTGGTSYAPLISLSTWEKMTRAKPLSGVMGSVMSLGLFTNYSVSLAGQVRKTPKGSYMYGYSGFGGQYVFVDRDNNLSFAYLTNFNSVYNIELDPRFRSLLRAMYDNV